MWKRCAYVYPPAAVFKALMPCEPRKPEHVGIGKLKRPRDDPVATYWPHCLLRVL